MSKMTLYIILYACLALFAKEGNGQTRSVSVIPERERNFDAGWKFFRGGVQGGENVTMDDDRWRSVNLPHDWSIEDLPGSNSPFDSNAVSQTGGGFTTGGTGWYRKKFQVDGADKGKRIHIYFEAVYMNADVWCNGHFLGNHPYGYTSFWYDLTPYLQFGQTNVIAVQVRNEGQNSRWYAGAGIYRHVWLTKSSPIAIAEWGVAITTGQIGLAAATVAVKTHIRKEGVSQGDDITGYRLRTTLTGPAGKIVAVQEDPLPQDFERRELVQYFKVDHPAKWSVDTPALYTAECEIVHDLRLLDRTSTRFGIREVRADAVSGFLLNGQPLKLKGACVHQDHGPLGVASYDRAEERRVRLLKDAGFNAVRCAHNPPAPAFLDYCDSLGMLVIDEAFDMWMDGKNAYDYHFYFDQWWKRDVAAMVNRDRNHPSVIMWSIGNEIPNKDSPAVVKMGLALAAYTRALDSSRMITGAVNEEKDPFFDMLDIAGYNYGLSNYAPDHIRKADRVMLSTESYPFEAFDYWMQVKDHPYVIGDFVWTGFDYIGEASIGWRGYWPEKGFYPWNLAFCGDIDICGWKRPQSYYRDVLWKPNQISLFVQPPFPSFALNPAKQAWSKWNWEDVVPVWDWEGASQKPLRVVVYSSCEEVELLLNGHSLGRRSTNRSNRFTAEWWVPYQKGVLKAVGMRKNKVVGEAELQTAGKPDNIALTPDRKYLTADGQDLSYITVAVNDNNGLLAPASDRQVSFVIAGPGRIVGVGNSDPTSVESFQRPSRRTWHGKCMVIVQSTGEAGIVVLHAKADGLPESMVQIKTGKDRGTMILD